MALRFLRKPLSKFYVDPNSICRELVEIMQRKHLVSAMRVFAAFMIFATILFLIGPVIGTF